VTVLTEVVGSSVTASNGGNVSVTFGDVLDKLCLMIQGSPASKRF